MDTAPTPLLVLESYQTFGKNSFWIFVSAWLSTPTVFLVIAFVISIARRVSLVPPEYQKIAALGSLLCFGIALVFGIIAFFIARFTYKSQGFSVSMDAFKIRKGIFTKQETAIPYRQIQNVEIERTLVHQISGISKLVIVTAGHDDPTTTQNESKAVLEMIDRDLAIELQTELLKRANIERVINVSK